MTSKKKKTSTIKGLRKRGLDAAVRFLERQGFEILERSWKCEAGSIDLIVQDCDALVFVEVKAKMRNGLGFLEDAITKDKRRKFENIAIEYLTVTDVVDIAVRFDVITIDVVGTERAFLRHHVNAFSIGD